MLLSSIDFYEKSIFISFSFLDTRLRGCDMVGCGNDKKMKKLDIIRLS